jgi:hypothetical protein
MGALGVFVIYFPHKDKKTAFDIKPQRHCINETIISFIEKKKYRKKERVKKGIKSGNHKREKPFKVLNEFKAFIQKNNRTTGTIKNPQQDKRNKRGNTSFFFLFNEGFFYVGH